MRIEIDNLGEYASKLDGIYSHSAVFKIDISVNKRDPIIDTGNGIDKKGYYFLVNVHGEDYVHDNSNIFIYCQEYLYRNYKVLIEQSPYFITIYLLPINFDAWLDISEQKNLTYGSTKPTKELLLENTIKS